ncbi:MAG TPA: lysylphosphatidylglycerol synthase transmembrane domain-containing protein [Chitinophagaceae bacterium]|jgi:uncharacterized membrane protein YbhN (UPF0104 family)|nr:lysylphosphatidylglycerol synthase transmembrane domain-containing protein [Chitinophagaceae bacterium]
MKLNRNTKIFINYFLGPLLFIWLSWSIYRQIQRQPNLEEAWKGIKTSFHTPLVWNLVGVILLMVVNWSIEALKWKISVRPIQPISFLRSFRAILSGVSFSVSTPNRVGEYLGRVLYMDEGNRLKTISITIVGSISQLIITLLMGCAGLIILRPAIESHQLITPMWMNVIIYGTAAVLAGTLLFYFRLSWLIRWVDRLPGSNRFAYLVKALEDFDAMLLLRLLFLSLIRFIVFIIQYYLLFHLFAVDVSWVQTFWVMSVSFLVMAVIPSIAIVELVQRGKVMTTIMVLFTANGLGVSFTALGIWLINLIVPAIVGSVMILGMRKMVGKKEGKEDR